MDAIEHVIDLPSRLEKRSARWFIIFMGMMIFSMAGAAVYYLMRDVQEMREENNELRSKLSTYLVEVSRSTAGVLSTAGLAMDRCSAALREQAQTNREVAQSNKDVKSMLAQLKTTLEHRANE
jgi:hypothetical protein